MGSLMCEVNRSLRVACLAAAALLLPALVALRSAPAEEARRPAGGGDSRAPELAGGPIQYLAKGYRAAYVDAAGRVWLRFRRPGGDEPPRAGTFDHLVCRDLPDKVLEFPAANWPIGFDRQGRFWDVTRYGLGCTEVDTLAFTERYAAPGMDPGRLKAPKRRQDASAKGFAPIMLGHSSGRLYFMDSYGLHVLDGETWSYRLFDPPPERLVNAGGWSMGYSPRIVEGPDGTVYAWALMNAASGLWTHDGKTWKHHAVDICEGIVPLEGRQCLASYVQGSRSSGTVRIGRLALDGAKVPEAHPSDTVAGRWSSFRHVLTVPRGATLVEAYDRRRSARVLAMVTPGREVRELPSHVQRRWDWRTLVPQLAPLGDGRTVLPTHPLYTWDGRRLAPLFANPLAANGRFLGADKRGRVFLRADGPARIAVVAPESLTASPSLPVKVFGLVEEAVVDSEGRVWAKFRDRDFVSCHAAGSWRHDPPPAGLPDRPTTRPVVEDTRRLQALGQGMMLARLPGRGACLCDGKGWRGYASLRELVEANLELLRKVIDNASAGPGPNPLLALDAGGRVWAAKPFTMRTRWGAGADVYDGRQWDSVERPFLMGPGGRLCVCGTEEHRGSIFDAGRWPPERLSALPESAEMPWEHRGVHFDKAGRFWAFEGPFRPAWRWDNGQWTKIDVQGRCLLNDSAGRMWFDDGFTKLTVADAAGKAGRAYEHPAFLANTPVVEQAPGTCWWAASDGLMQLGVTSRGGLAEIVVKRRYPDLVPQGRVRQLLLDGDGGLWVNTGRLCRVTLPEVSGDVKEKE